MRIRREVVDLAHDYEKSITVLRCHRQSSTYATLEIERLTTRLKELWGNFRSALSCQLSVQAKQVVRAQIIEREREECCSRTHHQAMVDAETALTIAVETLQLAKSEDELLAYFSAQLWVL